MSGHQEQYEQDEKELIVAIVRGELQAWLRRSDEGRAVEMTVGRLLVAF